MNDAPPPLDRVLMTADPIGGVWNFALELCRGLGDAGVEVILATMGAPLQPEQQREADALGNVEIVESTLRVEWMSDPWHDVSKAGTWLEWLEAQFAPDIVHLNGYAHGSLPWTAPVIVTAHSDVLSWWEAVKAEPAPAEWDDYRHAVKAGLRGADLITAPSCAMLNALERHYGALPATRVIYNGRDPQAFSAADKKEPFILSVGRLWDEAKNVTALTGIAGELEWPVRVAGEGRSPDGKETELKNVEVLGRCGQDQLREIYRGASIYAAPALYEPFGLSVLEAGLSGCTLVLGDIASLREIWDGAALFVTPHDRRELRSVVAHLIANPAQRTELGRRARERAQQFTAERMVRGYLSAYTELAAAPYRAGGTFSTS